MTPVSKSDRGAWIQTFTGRAFYPMAPHWDDIDIKDIAHALSMQCRFTGHLRRFYSVAEHSVRVAWAVEELLNQGSPVPACGRVLALLQGLLHDASEAYLIDVAKPVKSTPEMTGYRTAEHNLQQLIYARFGVSEEEEAIVKTADQAMLAIEARDLMGPLLAGWERWTPYAQLLPKVRLSPATPLVWWPDEAEKMFLSYFRHLEEHLGRTA